MSKEAGRQISLEARLADSLARAEFRLGELNLIKRTWSPWLDFAYWPLTARNAVLETRRMGMDVDLAGLLSQGALPHPGRPNKGLRTACGLVLAKRELEAGRQDTPLIPSQVAETFSRLDAPWLIRGGAMPSADFNLPGLGVWSLAPRLMESGLPALLVAAITQASWQHQGPDHPKTDACGWVLLGALGTRLGIIPQAMEGLGQVMEPLSAEAEGSFKGVLQRLRMSGAWREFAGYFFEAVAQNAAQQTDLALATQDMLIAHRELVATWVRAPRHPARLLDMLIKRPVVEIPDIAQEMEVTQRTAAQIAGKLKELAVLEEITGQKRGRRYAYRPLLDLLIPPPEEDVND